MVYKIIAATGCPTGIAHTYMAQEALEQAAKDKNVSIKVETHGQIGVENQLTHWIVHSTWRRSWHRPHFSRKECYQVWSPT